MGTPQTAQVHLASGGQWDNPRVLFTGAFNLREVRMFLLAMLHPPSTATFTECLVYT